MSKIDINNDEAHIIAEIGHNHQGSLEKALQLVKMAKDAGADSVKFQKRNNKKLYTKEFLILSMITETAMEKLMDNIEMH